MRADQLLAISIALSATGHPQSPATASPRTIMVQPDPSAPGLDANIPSPPRCLVDAPPDHVTRGQEGRRGEHAGLPEPVVAETHDAGGLAPLAPGDFRFFMNQVVTPAGASRSTVGEPSAIVNRDTALQTGNAYAALSQDAGMTWTSVSPFARFPAADGGFCCDQRALYVPSHDLTFWLLQYAYSATTATGRHRLVVIDGRDNLRSLANAVATYTSYSLTPQLLGFPTGTRMDFPDIASSADFLYGAANVLNTGGGSVMWRVSLDQLKAGGNITINFYTDATLGERSYRFTQGATTTMYWAGNETSPTLRLYWWTDAGCCASWQDKTLSAWNRNGLDSIGPDGINWLLRAGDSRVGGAYATATEIGFMWMSGPIGTRTQAFVRVARFRTADRTLIDQPDIYNQSYAFGYPAACSNARGDVGIVVAVGGGTLHPHASATIVDAYQPWASLTTYRMSPGTNGPVGGNFGDYFTVMRHPTETCTFIGTGMAQQGGTANTNSEPRYAWFGREECEPSWVTLAVEATGAGDNLVPVTVNRTDRNGAKDGTTRFTRSYVRLQDYALTAPLTHNWNGNTYAFDRWALQTIPNGAFVLQPVDERTLDVSGIGISDDTAQARYALAGSVWFTSSPSGVVVNVDRPDIYGRQGGTASFNRTYKIGTAIVADAAPTFAGRQFYRWREGTVLHPVGRTALSLEVNGPVTVEAMYWFHTTGAFRSFGAGCAGSNGVPVLAGSGTPEIGAAPTYALTSGPRSSPVILALGQSATLWAGIPLPFTLPGTSCTVYNDVALSYVALTDSAGAASRALPIPDAANLIGMRIFLQAWCLDQPANSYGVTTSNDVETTLGGWRP